MRTTTRTYVHPHDESYLVTDVYEDDVWVRTFNTKRKFEYRTIKWWF